MEKKIKASPAWQVLELVSLRLDPQTLATASCVCKSWSATMSSDHLWRPFCSAAYPSLSNLNPAVPYSKLYSLGRAAEKRRRQKKPEPKISTDDLIFAISVQSSDDQRVAAVIKPGGRLRSDPNGIFRFDIDVSDSDETVMFEAGVEGSLKITWNVLLRGFKGVLTVVDSKKEEAFSKELPAAAWSCSSGGGESGLVADVSLGMRENGGGRMVVEKISVGLLSVVSWSYVSMDDGLRYLQYFLLPSNGQ